MKYEAVERDLHAPAIGTEWGVVQENGVPIPGLRFGANEVLARLVALELTERTEKEAHRARRGVQDVIRSALGFPEVDA